MLIVNIGKQGMIRENKQFELGVNVEVSDVMGKYLLEKYSNPKMAIHFQKALNAQEHETVQEADENPVQEQDDPVVMPKKRGRKPKKK